MIPTWPKKKTAPNYLLIIGGISGVLFLLLVILSFYNSTPNNSSSTSRISDSNLTSIVGATPEQYASSPVRGNPSAPITIYEFSNLACPYSALIQTELDAVLAKYPEQVKIVWKDAPPDYWPEAQAAHQAARCAQAQGKFWKYTDELWISQDDFSSVTGEPFDSIAKKLSLDMPAFEKCQNENAMAADIKKDLDEAIAIGVGGTPTLIIGKEILSGVYSADEISAVIEEQL